MQTSRGNATDATVVTRRARDAKCNGRARKEARVPPPPPPVAFSSVISNDRGIDAKGVRKSCIRPAPPPVRANGSAASAKLRDRRTHTRGTQPAGTVCGQQCAVRGAAAPRNYGSRKVIFIVPLSLPSRPPRRLSAGIAAYACTREQIDVFLCTARGVVTSSKRFGRGCARDRICRPSRYCRSIFCNAR